MNHPSFVVLVVIAAITLVAANDPCPVTCNTQVEIGNTNGIMQIGPAAVITYAVLASSGFCVEAVSVALEVSSQPYGTYVLNASNPAVPVNFNFGTSPFNINGTGSLRLDTGCGVYSQFQIPQLLIQFAGYADGVEGGYDGAVIFNDNRPSTNNNFTFSNEGVIYYAACIKDEAGLSSLHNATVWIELEGIFIGASYLDLFHPTTTAEYGFPHGGNTTMTLNYISDGVVISAYSCEDDFNCFPLKMELFSVAACPPNA